MQLENEYIARLNDVDLEWDFEYYEFPDGEDEPGVYYLTGADAKEWKKAKGWKQDAIDKTSSIEFSQSDISEVQNNAIKNGECSEDDKILLDHLLDLMD